MNTFYVRPNMSNSNYVLSTTEGEVSSVRFDWSAKADHEDTSVSSADWSVESGTATISGATESADVASAKITTASSGNSIIKVAATMADGQIDIVLLRVKCAAIPTTESDYE